MAKLPQDHKSKKLPVKEVDGGKEVTIDGMQIILRDAAFKDHLVMRQLAKMQKESVPVEDKIIINGEMIDRILGVAQADAFIAAYADEFGYTDFTVLAQKFNEIVGAAYPNS